MVLLRSLEKFCKIEGGSAHEKYVHNGEGVHQKACMHIWGRGQGGYDIINICVRTMHMTPKQLGFSMENKFQS